MITPFTETARGKQPYYNALAEYAEERNIAFLNCNLVYDKIGLDPKTDFSTGRHLSKTGAEKATYYLVHYIRQNFDLEDHRGDNKYNRWEQNMLQGNKD